MVQLYNQDGTKIATTTTGRQGHYAFKIKAAGAYVVREVLPKRLVQTSPTFATGAPPTGAYVAGAGNTSWNYTTSDDNPANGPVGPYAWDTIAPAGDEPFQSPINLTGPTVDLSKYITVNYATSTPTDILNNTHQFQVQYSPVSTTDTVTVGGTTFNLAQFHYHDPAENHVDGHVYQLEEHFVNTAASGAETVVAVFFKLGAHNSALDPILNAASGLTTPNAKTTNTTPIDFSGLLPTNTQGYFFEGSLTTPPLSQPVNWFVYATPITLDYAQLKQYETAAGAGGFLPNARPLQALDGRILNEIDANVSFTTQSVGGVNFTVAKA
jgi:carbonic anhydrase